MCMLYIQNHDLWVLFKGFFFLIISVRLVVFCFDESARLSWDERSITTYK